MAIANPERVDRLVLIGSGLPSANPVLLEVMEAVAGLEDPVPVEFVRDFQSGTAYAPVPEAFMDEIIAESLKAPARVWRDVFAGLLAYDDTHQLAQIGGPTLLLSGDQDAIFGGAEQERLAHAIPGATLKVYSETGHCPNWDDPNRLLQTSLLSLARPDSHRTYAIHADVPIGHWL
jgi:non-heme chloroperoxidase